MKKFLSLLLALVMVLAVAAPAMAEGTNTITIDNEKTGHTYEAYQIFAGTARSDQNGYYLGNITWGSGITEEGKAALGDAAAVAATLTSAEEATKFAQQLRIKEYLSDTKATSTPIEGGYEITGLEDGYYLVKDVNGSQQDANDFHTAYILRVLEDVEVTPKGSTPTLEKKVTDDETPGLQDSADYDIGDAVPFTLTATLGDISMYKSYDVTFYDTLSAGLTFNYNSLVVKIDGKVLDQASYHDEYKTLDDGSYFIELAIQDVIGYGATSYSVITVEYTATLNEKAVIGSAGNPNEAYLEYSNNPDGSESGQTPSDKVKVFTYSVSVFKQDENKTPLAGAMFELYQKQGEDWVKCPAPVVDSDSMFTFDRLDAGIYKLVESVTPAGYNTIDPIYFSITAEHEAEATDPKLTSAVFTELNEDLTPVEGKDPIFNNSTTTVGYASTVVINESGAQLPSTGGVGTTMLYVGGGVLLLAAVVLLVMKRRTAEA